MVTNNHYRWDFVGLSTDTKPTPDTSSKVVDGSTFYCSDTSKLYVYCKNNWYERKPLGSGGGTEINVVQTTGESTTDVMSQKAATSMIFNDPSNRAQIVIGAGSIVSQPTYPVVLGRNAKGRGESVSIGYAAGSTDSQRNYNVNLGSNAVCDSNSSVALGYYAKTTRGGEVNIGTGTNTYGYNNTSYRLLGGVHDPIDAHDAATKGYVDANAGGPTVVQTTGESTTDVMSQNAVTNMVFNNSSPANVKIGSNTTATSPNGVVVIGERASGRGNSIVIGSQANGSVNGAVVIGQQATIDSTNCTAIGNSSYGGNRIGGTAIGFSANVGVLHPGSVALGASAICTRSGEVYIGTVNTDYGYNSTNYRVLGGVHDGQDSHDAVTVEQVNGVIDAINTALSTNISHIGQI